MEQSLVLIYGCSDDLIEVEEHHVASKDVTLEAEFDRYAGEITIAFNSGTLVHVKYNDEGQWKIDVQRLAEGDEIERFFEVPEGADEAEHGYTDKLWLRTTATDVCEYDPDADDDE